MAAFSYCRLRWACRRNVLGEEFEDGLAFKHLPLPSGLVHSLSQGLVMTFCTSFDALKTDKTVFKGERMKNSQRYLNSAPLAI